MLKAKVAELVDAHDSKSCILGCAGSIPAFGTNKSLIFDEREAFLLSFTELKTYKSSIHKFDFNESMNQIVTVILTP